MATNLSLWYTASDAFLRLEKLLRSLMPVTISDCLEIEMLRNFSISRVTG